MNSHLKITLAFFLAVFTLWGQPSFAQDSADYKIKFDTSWAWGFSHYSTTYISSYNYDYIISHEPTKREAKICKGYRKLIDARPTTKNHHKFYKLACALWEMSRLPEAEKMFLKIMDSRVPSLDATYYHSSDIPGDTNTNTYGYGSFTSNYKNSVCRYLTKIYIEEKKFDKALRYIELADNEYPVSYSCGTGYRFDRNEVEGLLALCYEGLEMHDSIIARFLPQYAEGYGDVLIRALKKTYTQDEINKYLEEAENSIVLLDTFSTMSYTIHNYGEPDEYADTTYYTTGTAEASLFGWQVTLPTPYPMQNGEKVTRERFAKEFSESSFYWKLSGGDY
jgi:hypothetical protein